MSNINVMSSTQYINHHHTLQFKLYVNVKTFGENIIRQCWHSVYSDIYLWSVGTYSFLCIGYIGIAAIFKLSYYILYWTDCTDDRIEYCWKAVGNLPHTYIVSHEYIYEYAVQYLMIYHFSDECPLNAFWKYYSTYR